ncbi:MAG: hypothetical protein RDV48_27905 [Candidatus Eremiobacteraeota bacterium]|nr:hypothetical protein [Candidatus Eremiobacteraeota bacterium]
MKNLTASFMLLLMMAAGLSAAWARGASPIGALKDLSGKVYLIRNTEKSAAKEGMNLEEGDGIITDKDSRATIFINEKARIVLNASTEVFLGMKFRFPVYALESGQVRGLFDGCPAKIIILAGDATITADNAEIDVYAERQEKNHLIVLRGRVWWVVEKWAARKTLPEGEHVLWDERGAMPFDDKRDDGRKKMLEWYPAKPGERGPAILP